MARELASAALAFIWMLGFLTSAAFYISLDRPGDFANESVLDQWVWGFRSLVAPAFFALAAVIIVRLVSLAVRAFGRVAGLRGSLGLDSPIAAGKTLLVLQVAVVVWVFWYFRNAFQRVADAGERCYAIGERGAELLLYCPDAKAPRNRVVPAADPRLARTPIVESIVTSRTPADPGR